jgi:hypothetical protein
MLSEVFFPKFFLPPAKTARGVPSSCTDGFQAEREAEWSPNCRRSINVTGEEDCINLAVFSLGEALHLKENSLSAPYPACC